MLSETRQKQLLDSVNSVARKVFAVVPIGEVWTLEKIESEIRRCGQNMSRAVIHGCLRNMVDIGLIKEPAHNQYTRNELRPRRPRKTREETVTHISQEMLTNRQTTLAQAMEKATLTAPLKVVPETKPTILGELAAMAASMREQGEDLIAEAQKLEDLALRITEEKELENDELIKLRAWKQSIKGLLGE